MLLGNNWTSYCTHTSPSTLALALAHLNELSPGLKPVLDDFHKNVSESIRQRVPVDINSVLFLAPSNNTDTSLTDLLPRLITPPFA